MSGQNARAGCGGMKTTKRSAMKNRPGEGVIHGGAQIGGGLWESGIEVENLAYNVSGIVYTLFEEGVQSGMGFRSILANIRSQLNDEPTDSPTGISSTYFTDATADPEQYQDHTCYH